MQDDLKGRIAAVIVDISLSALDRPFEYKIPENLSGRILPGSAVHVPFGRGNRRMLGYVIELKDTSEWDEDKLKDIIDIAEKEISTQGRLIGLAAWMRSRYGGSMNQAIKTVLPMRRSVKSVEEHWLNIFVSDEQLQEHIEFYKRRHSVAKLRLAEYIRDSREKPVSMKKALADTHTDRSVIRSLEKDGIIEVTDERVYRTPEDVARILQEKTDENQVLLSDEQIQALNIFKNDIDSGENNKYLLYGVTGSGKTEVYIEMLKQVLAKGRQAIVLIPEIALTHQTVARLMDAFGDRVCVMHSRLSAGEKYDQYEKVLNDQVDIMVGPRSAVFAPFERLGLIIIDEEHENSYISEQTPSYNAVEVAIERANREDIPIVLGSATPSVASYYRAQEGRYKTLRLRKRAPGAAMPKVSVVDLREELKAKNHSIFSRLLKEKIKDRLRNNEQTMLFINRRGYAGFVSCRSCGYVLKCPHCDVSMTAHLRYGKADSLMCHYCGTAVDMPDKCPECGSAYIAAFGLGTEKVVEITEKEFPNARVLRMDADTTKNKNGHEKILAPFRAGEADILVGTQMIVKGHDLPNVTLVGAIAADLSMHDGDYHSSEKTYQLLMQAGGRAGRGDKPGEFVIQTYRPDEYCIEAVRTYEPEHFYNRELAFRRLLGYPPYKSMLQILVSSTSETDAHELVTFFADELKNNTDISVVGPAQDKIAKVKDMYRKVLYIKADEDESITDVIEEVSEEFRKLKWARNCRISFTRGG